jgi:hypothetical protein
VSTPLRTSDGIETIECGERSPTALIRIVVEPPSLFDRDQDRDGSVITFDQETIAGRGRVSNGAQRLAEIERAGGLRTGQHSQT